MSNPIIRAEQTVGSVAALLSAFGLGNVLSDIMEETRSARYANQIRCYNAEYGEFMGEG